MTVRRGEIYWVALDPVKGSEAGGVRPALVVQNDLGNLHSPTTIVAAITAAIPEQDYPHIVVLSPEESGLTEVSAVLCGQLATIQQAGPASRLRPPRGEERVRPIGRVSDERMRDVDDALRFSLELD